MKRYWAGWLLIGLLVLSSLQLITLSPVSSLYAGQPCFTPASVLADHQTIPTNTPTPTATATETSTPSPTTSPTDTIEPCPPTITPTATQCLQASAILAPELTPTASSTATPTPTMTATSTMSPTPTSTSSGEPTVTEIATVTPTGEPCPPTATPSTTVSPCVVGALLLVPAQTATATATTTPTPTMTATSTTEPTPTATELTATPTNSPTASATAMPCPPTGPTSTVEPPPSLTIHKFGPEMAQVSEPFVYALVVTNGGNTPVNGLRIFDQLPATVGYVDAPGGTRTVENGIARVEWVVDSLAAGSQVTVTLTVSATASVVNAQYGVRTSDDLVVPGQAPVLTLISNDVSGGQANPESGGSIVSNSGNVLLNIPPGAVTSTVNFGMVVVEQPINTAGFAGLAFVIQARNPDGTPVTSFPVPIRLTVNYEDRDWQAAGLIAETNLNLFYWAEPNWVALLPCDGCRHDTEANTFEIVLDHLTLFALREGLPEQSHLPLIQR